MKPRLLSLFFIVACAALLAQNYSPTFNGHTCTIVSTVVTCP
jgi:hypothetical protein